MNIGIIGLGLIGGSMAKAFKQAGMTIYGYDIDSTVTGFVRMSGAIDGTLTEDTLKQCEVVLVCATPEASEEWLNQNAAVLSKGTIVIDCCGTKRRICSLGFRLAKENGFTFIGGHPMAGRHQGGYKNSRADVFRGATMILTPEKRDDLTKMTKLKEFFLKAGFGNVAFMTPEEHDDLVAFTSQMTHLAANAFIKNEEQHEGKIPFGGSFRDFTRVAELNDHMWAELFLENRDNLLRELRIYIAELKKYEEALDAGDEDRLRELLHEGTEKKKNVISRA